VVSQVKYFWKDENFLSFLFLFLLSGSGSTIGLLDLNLDVRHGGTGTTKVSLDGLGVLGVIVGDSGLDSILGKHRAVHYDCQYKLYILSMLK